MGKKYSWLPATSVCLIETVCRQKQNKAFGSFPINLGPGRVSCFSHLVGATRPRAGDVQGLSPDVMTWRSGIFKTLSKHLVQKDLLSILEECVYCSRPCTSTLFSVMWKTMLEFLKKKNELDAVECLLATYLVTTKDETIDATWRHGCDRVQPSTASGSQAQEAFHHHRLRAVMPGLRIPFSTALEQIRKLCKSRAAELERCKVFHTVPGRSYKQEFISGDSLAVVGRTCVRTFLTCGSFAQKQACCFSGYMYTYLTYID